MSTNNKLDKSFGPVGSTAGYFLLLAGLVATYTSLFGLILVVMGACLGFTATCTIIDFEKRKVKFSKKLFGIIPTGKWISITPEMKIGNKLPRSRAFEVFPENHFIRSKAAGN